MCIPLVYLAVRAMGYGHFASVTAAILLAADVMHVVLSRHICSDPILHFFSILAMFAMFVAERIQSVGALVFEGVCLGCAAACKYTSGGIVVLAIIRQFPGAVFANRIGVKAAISRCLVIVGVVVVVHFAVFAVHFHVLPFAGPDCAGLPESVRAGLISRSDPDWNAREIAPSMIRRILELIWYMHKENMGLKEHYYKSSWYEWPLATGRWILYWSGQGRHIICVANVLLWWPVCAGVLVSAVRAVVLRDSKSPTTAMTLGWALNILPFALVSRALFLYHYAIPLIFGCCNLAGLIEECASPHARGFCYCAVMASASLGFLLWCPWAYALQTPDFDFLVWNEKWRTFAV
jgi:dolichyl-phosphate-mannose--protein O-mannosyl transferase